MSSPVHDDLDRRVMYAPPWARETPQQPPRAIIAAVERLRQERLRAAAPSPHEAVAADIVRGQQRDRDQRELPLGDRASPADIETAMAEAVRSAWTPPPLEPVTMPDPPRSRLDAPTWGMLTRLGGAVGLAAAVALFVTGALPLPSIDISLGANEAAKAASIVAHALGIRDTREAKPAVLVADASPAVATLPPTTPTARGVPPLDVSLQGTARSEASPAAPIEALTAFASLDTPAAASPASPGSKIESPPVPAAPEAAQQRVLDPDEVASLVKRGQAVLAEGDISSARLLLRRAAEAGDAAAALALAGTYDRAELAKLNVIGVVHDHAQAKVWYAKAVTHGSAEAVRRLQQLAQGAD